MHFPRRSGILLHPTSLPGRYGIGDLGPAAFRFIDWLHAGQQRLWQLLPLGPTGYGDSPYQSFSAFAGNPMLLSPERLIEQGLLTQKDLADAPRFPDQRVDFGALLPWKAALLRTAFARFQARGEADGLSEWAVQQGDWLEDFALFMALKAHFGGGPWREWPDELRRRDEAALARYRDELAEAIAFQRFLQWQFDQQWHTLRAYAHSREVQIVGDIPIFIAHDSADAWAQQSLFSLHEDGSLEVQAGVPPDYFSETGQLWGNPLYRWERMDEQGYRWWIDRFRAIFEMVDLVRLDHFRGFEAYWAVPGGDATAQRGEWRKGPGAALFETVRAALGPLPIIAEDLGVITPEVEALRAQFDYPGMRILQFAFTADTSNAFLPHNYPRNTVAYTGTHDNESTRGWFENLDERTRRLVLAYFASDERGIVRAMIRGLMISVADTVIVPMQDILDLGNEARMNFPGKPGGNWQWRVTEAQLRAEDAAWLREMAGLYQRQ